MTIHALITGQAVKDAEVKQSSKGNEYAVVLIKSGDNFVRCNVFTDSLDEVAAVRRGDAVSVTGKLEAGIWERDGKPTVSLSMMANKLMTVNSSTKPNL